MIDEGQEFLVKAVESLAGAESEFANGRFANAANRCYYACLQAAIAALIQAGIRPSGDHWGHGFVQAQFARQLINQHKRYPSGLRDTLARNLELRHAADYQPRPVRQVRALRALQRTRLFVEAIVREREV